MSTWTSASRASHSSLWDSKSISAMRADEQASATHLAMDIRFCKPRERQREEQRRAKARPTGVLLDAGAAIPARNVLYASMVAAQGSARVLVLLRAGLGREKGEKVVRSSTRSRVQASTRTADAQQIFYVTASLSPLPLFKTVQDAASRKVSCTPKTAFILHASAYQKRAKGDCPSSEGRGRSTSKSAEQRGCCECECEDG